MVSSISIEERDLANQHLDRCISFAMCGKLDQAIKEAEKAIELDPDFSQAYNKLGDFYMKKGWIQKAADVFRKAIELDPTSENSHFDLGCALAHLGDFSNALEYLKKSLELNPAHYEVYGHLGQIFMAMNQLPEAIDAFKKALMDDSDNLMATFNLAIALISVGKDTEAKNHFNKVIARYKQLVGFKERFAEGYYYIGLSNFYMGNLDDAIKNLQKAVEFDTEEVDYHYSFGMLYSDADAFYSLAEAQIAANNSTEARENLKQALALEPDNQKFLSLKSKVGM